MAAFIDIKAPFILILINDTTLIHPFFINAIHKYEFYKINLGGQQ